MTVQDIKDAKAIARFLRKETKTLDCDNLRKGVMALAYLLLMEDK